MWRVIRVNIISNVSVAIFISMTLGVALVQGASRGIGAEFCRHLLSSRPDVVVMATCRSPATATDLIKLKEQYPDRLETFALDVTKESQIEEVASQVKSLHGKLDLLINSSAMLHPSGRGETGLKDVSMQGLQDTIKTNTIGPLLMAKYFAPLLVQGNGSFGVQNSESKKQHRSVIANISAKVGSISDNGLGGWYSYRMSKSALNMATKNLSIELGRGKNKVLCVSLHPGTVNTDLSRPYHRNVPKDKLFSTEYSVNSLMDIINNLKVEDTGSFYSWDGSVLPF